MKKGKELLSICLIYLFMLSLADLAVAGTGVFIDSGQSLYHAYSYDVGMGDLDGDGDLDAFIGNGNNWPNRVWLNDGLGNFTDSGQLLGNKQSHNIALGDLDSDGDLDAFVANWGAHNKVYLNDGLGIFTDSGQNLGNQYSQSYGVDLGDLDGDGDLDAFVMNGGGSHYTKIWLNDGWGIFTDSGQNLNSLNLKVSLGDLDNDGDLDAFCMKIIFLNDGSGNFTSNGQWLNNSYPTGQSLGDVDNDGDLDVFVTNGRPPNKIWLNNGSGIFTDSGQSLGGSNGRNVALGDVDGDGDLDAFVANEDIPDKVYLNDGWGIFTDSGQSLGGFGQDYDSRSVALGDVDDDGDLDAFVASLHAPNKVWLNDGTELPPVADAGGPYIVNATSWEGADVQLDGTASYDPDEDVLTYGWDLDLSMDSDGDGDPVNDLDATGATPSQLFPIGQTDVSLVVTDEHGLVSAPDVTTVTVSVIEVNIDIKPGSYPNSINMGSRGVIPVAFLTDPEFDASTIDPLSVILRGEDLADGLVKLRGKKDPTAMANLEDVDGDGDSDLVVHLDTERLSEYETDAVCELGALTYDGYVVSGQDTIHVVPE